MGEALRPGDGLGGPNTAALLGFGAIANLYVDPCAIDRGMLDPPPGPSVDDLVAALAALPGMETTAPTDVTVDGYAGKYVELNGPVEGQECGDEEAFLWGDGDPNGNSVPAPGAHAHPYRLWIVDVPGERLVIIAHDRPYTTPQQYTGREQIIDSIQIEVP